MTIKGLYAIIDNSFSPRYSHVELAHLMLLGGCRLLQLRIKGKGSAPAWNQQAFDISKKIMEFKNEFDFTYIVNDHVDVAGEIGADGVHVGSNDTPVADIRKRVGNKMMIGFSSHNIDEAVAAERHGADYIALGAIFPTKTKGPGHPVQGLARLKELCSKVTRPIVAIGGINRTNIESVIQTGVDSVAMITGLTQAEDIVSETRWYVNKMTELPSVKK